MKIADILKDNPNAELQIEARADWLDDCATASLGRETLRPNAFHGAGRHGEYNDKIDALAAKHLTPEVIRELDFDFAEDSGENGMWFAEVEAETDPDKNGVTLPVLFSVDILV